MLATENLHQAREVFPSHITSLLEAKDRDRLVFWGQPLMDVRDVSRFQVISFTAELHPEIRIAGEAELEDLDLIWSGNSKFAVNGKDYFDGATARFLKYMIRVREGSWTRLIVHEGRDVPQPLIVNRTMPFSFTMDFRGRLKADSPWAVKVCLIGQEERPVVYQNQKD